MAVKRWKWNVIALGAVSAVAWLLTAGLGSKPQITGHAAEDAKLTSVRVQDPVEPNPPTSALPSVRTKAPPPIVKKAAATSAADSPRKAEAPDPLEPDQLAARVAEQRMLAGRWESQPSDPGWSARAEANIAVLLL